MTNNILTVDSLTFGYEKNKNVLNNISFELKQGTITALLGKNGSGKSTLLDCIMGINDYKEGVILLNGRNIRNYSNKEFAQNVAYVAQETNINIDYTVQDFIMFGRTPYFNFGEKPQEKDYDKVLFFAKECEIEHLLSKEITKISGGERQLCYLCRALVQESKMLIFDEPTASLDFGNQYKLFSIMSDLQKKGKTILFTTHNPNQVLELNTNIVVVNNGNILCYGNARETLTKEIIKYIYNVDYCNTNNCFFYQNNN